MNRTEPNIFVSGNVMTGRGIDQILRYPVDPEIHEVYIRDARDYVRLAERISGRIPRGVSGDWLWRRIAGEWQTRAPLVKIANLETAITTSNSHWPGKGVNYRMHPKNLDALTAADFDICTLANNHVLDWELEGLEETLRTLTAAGIRYAGAGMDLEQAMAPAIHPLPGDRRILVFAMGTRSSGIPPEWSAGPGRPGVHLLPDLDTGTISDIVTHIEQYRRPGDRIVVSIHWGGNWGYAIPADHQHFARALIDALSVDLIHGHSSHHPLAIEFYKGTPVLYGCGDFINDYEGISGFEKFRGHLGLMYFLTAGPPQDSPAALELVPLQVSRFQLDYASRTDTKWLIATLKRESAPYNTTFKAAGTQYWVATPMSGKGE